MKIRRHHSILIFVLFIIILGNGCKTKKLAFKFPGRDLPESPEKLGHLAYQNNSEYKGLIIKNFKIKYTNDEKTTSLYGSAKMSHDSLILASLRAPLGIELMRALLSPDSAFIINRTEKNVILSDYSYITNRLNVKVNFNIIESLLSGNLPSDYRFIKKRNTFTKRVPDSSKTQMFIGSYYPKDQSQELKFQAWINPQYMKPSKLIFYKKRNLELFKVDISDYFKLGEEYYPGEVIIEHTNSENTKTTIRLIFSKFEETGDAEINFHFPSRYKTIRLN